MTTQYITSTDGTRTAYDITGGGPALMLLHGLGKARRDWHKLGYVRRLKDDFTVIAVDIRGNGQSDRSVSVEDYAVETICDDVLAVADACEVERFALWGFSFGGNIARYLGAWSERVTAIAVIGVPFGPAVPEEFDRFIDDFIQEWEPQLRAYNEGTSIAPRGRGAIASGKIAVFLACFQAMRAWPDIEPGDVKCPALLVAGTRNQSTMAWIEANRSALDESSMRVEVLEGLTHNQEFGKIERVFPVVAPFFKG